MNRHILVTGGAGFIGSHYVRQKLAAGFQVTVIDKLTYAGNRANLPIESEGLTFVRDDVCSREKMQALASWSDAIVHFAAESHVDRSVGSGADFARTNVLGAQVMLEAAVAVGVRKVVLVSTDEVYGSINEGSWTESSPLLPNSPYAASKAGADLIARAYSQTHGLDVSITRCSNNYGPRQHPEKMIPRFVTNLLEKVPIPLYGDGENVREWIHVDDHCRAIDLVLEDGQPGAIYNVGGHPMSNLRLTNRILEICESKPSMIHHVADRLGHDRRYSVDDSRIRTELGWEPAVDFDDGLIETINWYRSNRTWWSPLRRTPTPSQTASPFRTAK